MPSIQGREGSFCASRPSTAWIQGPPATTSHHNPSEPSNLLFRGSAMHEPVDDTTLFHISFRSALKTQTAPVTALCAVVLRDRKGDGGKKQRDGWTLPRTCCVSQRVLATVMLKSLPGLWRCTRALWMLTGNIYNWSLFPSSVQRYLGVAPPTLTMHYSVTESGIQLVRNKTLLWMKFPWSVSIFYTSL